MAVAKRDKEMIGLIGAIVVILILAARLVPNFVGQVSRAIYQTPEQTSNILDGLSALGIGTIIYQLRGLFVKGFLKSTWMFGGLLLIVEGIGDFVGFSVSDLWSRKSQPVE